MFKKMFAAILTVALILTLNASAFATEGENLDGQHDQGMTTEYYNPFGSNYSIIGTDDRKIISDTTVFPYLPISRIVTKFPCKHSVIGTGIMVSSKCMLTAGHILVCTECGEDATSITAYFGYKKDGTYHTAVTANSTKNVFYHNPNYTGVGNEAIYDYGYVVFSTAVGNSTGWYGIHAPTNSELREVPTLTVTGYSGKTLYSDSGNMYKYTSSRIYYLLDTESGASGAPVYDKEFGYYVWAIHTHGYDNDGNALNSGWRITSDFINELVDLGYVTRG